MGNESSKAIRAIQDFQPQTAAEVATKERMLHLLETETGLFTRENQKQHFTTSTLILSTDYQEVLLIHHKLFNAWSWTGGHNDGNVNFKAVAIKEAQEETGLAEFQWFSPAIQSLDILPVAKHQRRGEPVKAHEHLNVAYILLADKKAPLQTNLVETNGVKWWPLKDLLKISNEPHMVPIYQKLIKRLPIEASS